MINVTALERDMGRPPTDTEQITIRIPKQMLEQAEIVAKLISSTGFEANRIDAIRAAIARGFDVIARERGPFRVQAYDGVNSTCLYDVLPTLAEAVDRANALAKGFSVEPKSRWSTVRVIELNADEPIKHVFVDSFRKPPPAKKRGA